MSSRNSAHAALSGHYYLDDAIDEAGPDAELLFVRGLAFCSATLSDGFITDRQVRRAVGIGLDLVEDRCKALVAAGLWARDEEHQGYLVINYLKWNRSREEVMTYRARDAARKRSTRSPNGVQSESDDTSERSPTTTLNTHTKHTEHTESDRTPSGPVRSDSRASAPPDLTALRAQLDATSRKQRAPRRGAAT